MLQCSGQFEFIPPAHFVEASANPEQVSFGLASDLHMDFGPMNPEFFDWRGNCLLLAGDLAEEDRLRKMKDFWSRVSDMADQVYVILGNHEFYKSEIDVAANHMRDFLARYDNIALLDDDCVDFRGVKIFGGTMWTSFNNGDPIAKMVATMKMNDYKMIRSRGRGYSKLRIEQIELAHQMSMTRLENFCDIHKNDPMVVMTHHAPCNKSIRREHVGEHLLEPSYANRLENFIMDHENIKAWVHGHTHGFADYSIGECRVMCNTRGYQGERPPAFPAYRPYTFQIEV